MNLYSILHVCLVRRVQSATYVLTLRIQLWIELKLFFFRYFLWNLHKHEFNKNGFLFVNESCLVLSFNHINAAFITDWSNSDCLCLWLFSCCFRFIIMIVWNHSNSKICLKKETHTKTNWARPFIRCLVQQYTCV